jgi:hypothetical protein
VTTKDRRRPARRDRTAPTTVGQTADIVAPATCSACGVVHVDPFGPVNHDTWVAYSEQRAKYFAGLR